MSGERPATDAPTSLATVGLKADFTVDDGVSRGGDSSTVVTFSDDGELRVLREGPVKFLVLASGSPRRAKILRDAGVDFTVRKSEAEEVSYDDDPERTVSENALVKGSKGNILSADTIVWLDNRIFGKPRDLEEAAEFLRILSGRTHTVFTGVAYNGEVKVVKSFVTFRRLSEEDIKGYIETVRPLDRAGAYDIDESGSRIVASYEGSYENIMGLPLEPLEEWGIIKK
jgi:septum formation protein